MKLAKIVLVTVVGAWLVSLLVVGYPMTELSIPTYPNSLLSFELNTLFITTALATAFTAYLGVKSLLADGLNSEKGSK